MIGKLLLIFALAFCVCVEATLPALLGGAGILQNNLQSGYFGLNNPLITTYNNYLTSSKRRCPLCDPSVYSYCGDKLFHDSCCCNNPNNPYEQLPRQCQYADCSFLHSNTCHEHELITACCCIKK